MGIKISKKQKEKILSIIDNNEELPEGYKDLLFPHHKKEYELVYAGKERKEDIISETMPVPFQKVKTFGTNGKDWTNKLIFGDNLQILKEIYNDQRGQDSYGTKDNIKLIYIDPPFATKRDFMQNREKVYNDKIIGSEFLEFLRERMLIARELLASDGFVVVHLDQKKGHYTKCLFDEIFNESNFVNEIIWSYRSGGASKKTSLPKKHDTLLVYRRHESATVNAQKERQYLEKQFMGSLIDDQGRFYVDTLLRDVVEGVINVVRDWGIQEYNTRPVINVSAERIGYPTQKPEGLIALLLEIFSNKNDIVLDFFAGSGTTLAVAEKLGRKWIGCDIGKLSIYTTQKRLLDIKKSKDLENKNNTYGKTAKAFTIYNAGLYDYEKLRMLPWAEYRYFALKLFGIREENHKLSGIDLDGFRGNDHTIVFNHEKYKDVILDYGYIDDLHKNIGAKIKDKFFIIAPAGSVDFLEDYVEKKGIRYYILRIPYSIINELHSRSFEHIKQPQDESDVNDTVESVGFDFIQIPEVDCNYSATQKDLKIKIKKFNSTIRSRKPMKFKDKETLSMVMVDWDYNGVHFDFDKVFFADDLKKDKYTFIIDKQHFKDKMMIIYMDIFGNEKREIKVLKDFK